MWTGIGNISSCRSGIQEGASKAKVDKANQSEEISGRCIGYI